jgi:hypothetical protein
VGTADTEQVSASRLLLSSLNRAFLGLDRYHNSQVLFRGLWFGFVGSCFTSPVSWASLLEKGLQPGTFLCKIPAHYIGLVSTDHEHMT